MDGTQMTYWGEYARAHYMDVEMHLTWGLVKYADGCCDAWTRFFDDCLRAQGNDAGERILITVKDQPAETEEPHDDDHGALAGVALYVKHWHFVGYYTSPSEQSHDDLQGQGNPNPPSVFNCHWIIRYGGKFYDPSYGGDPRDTLPLWEDTAIDVFGYYEEGLYNRWEPNTTALETDLDVESPKIP